MTYGHHFANLRTNLDLGGDESDPNVYEGSVGVRFHRRLWVWQEGGVSLPGFPLAANFFFSCSGNRGGGVRPPVFYRKPPFTFPLEISNGNIVIHDGYTRLYMRGILKRLARRIIARELVEQYMKGWQHGVEQHMHDPGSCHPVHSDQFITRAEYWGEEE